MFDKDSLHHAYFIEGDGAVVLAELEAFLAEAFGIVRQGNPDVHYAEYESFGIDESRALQDMQSMRPVIGDKKIFILVADAMTSEAQNSLLKVFEEPTPGAHFFVISSSARILLPTLRSRMVVITHSSAALTGEAIGSDAKKFVGLSRKARIDYVADMIEDKDKAQAEDFLQALVRELSTTNGKSRIASASPARIDSIREILSLIRYLKDRSSSLKLILERVALLDL